jgi:uncharacterized membrane protein
MGEEPARQGASYLVKIGTNVVTATLSRVRSRIDLDTLAEVPAERLDLNDIGEARIVVDEAIAFDPYRRDPSTGGFILIDRETLDTVGMGLVREAWTEDLDARPQQVEERARPWFARASESSLRSLVKAVTWRLCGSLDTSILVFLFTGSLKLSTAIGMTEVLSKTALYYAHERLWTRMSFGKSQTERPALGRP